MSHLRRALGLFRRTVRATWVSLGARRGARPALGAAAAVVLGLTAVVVWTTVGGSDASAASCEGVEIPAHPDDTLVIEGDAWSGYAVFRDPQLMENSPYEAIYVDQPCQAARAADVTSGEADVAVTSLDQYLLHQPQGTLVGVIDQSRGADALVLGTVANEGFDSIDDIPALVEDMADDGDKPVLAYTGNSPSEMLLNELANTTGQLRLTDFDLVPVDQSATAYEMLVADEAQLAVLWEPDTSRAAAAGYTVTLSSADVPESIVDVIVASDRLIERDPEAVVAVLTAYYHRIDAYMVRPAALERFLAEDAAIDDAEAASIVAGIKLYGTIDADAFMNQQVFPLDKPLMEQSVDSIESVLALIHADLPLDSAHIDGRYVGTLAQKARLYAPGGPADRAAAEAAAEVAASATEPDD
jgi:hypothetical protein